MDDSRWPHFSFVFILTLLIVLDINHRLISLQHAISPGQYALSREHMSMCVRAHYSFSSFHHLQSFIPLAGGVTTCVGAGKRACIRVNVYQSRFSSLSCLTLSHSLTNAHLLALHNHSFHIATTNDEEESEEDQGIDPSCCSAMLKTTLGWPFRYIKDDPG